MSPSKLRLKRTPAEQAEHDLRKARKIARKAAKHRRQHDEDEYDESDGHSHRKKRRRTSVGLSSNDIDDSDSEYGPQPASSHRAHKPDYDRIQAEIEEQRFRDKLWGALGDDERLDSVEASLNSYAHVPRRWRGGGMERMDDESDVDPRYMEDEEYAEWIRAGMWRKKHAAEHEEQVRKQAEHNARKAKERAIREETKRLERVEEEARRNRRRAREQMRAGEARELPCSPWPIYLAYPAGKNQPPSALRIDDFTTEAISSFLLPHHEEDYNSEASKKGRRERLREAMLRFHPDKFEGRVMARVRSDEREIVREAVGVVARTLNTLMAQGK
ncbi:hypothetical protein DICSQDRAFT_183303 [Dichomitus squalens LYAD-421 SS1]|uniref:Uncharacterized protein n=1 Tax=Dichomitus squalens (strain LYAD-421) TaxID=732165 RepID=R7SM80_DICSQ|nr:uncharacterized protein DICSQDRAFT_183303 [Dichomitus squalens LYAD-421 SS1]EJF57254.1 hypothetical protein DICSQDRAFT_183303 [Dichomitus squalens LYAD-421 SS1]